MHKTSTNNVLQKSLVTRKKVEMKEMIPRYEASSACDVHDDLYSKGAPQKG